MWEKWENFTKKNGITFTYKAEKSYFWVSILRVPVKKRGKGLGSQAMKMFQEIAKKSRMNIKLMPMELCKTTDICKLRDFYVSLHFKNKGNMVVWYHREN